jgi:FAS-associated factor 2
MSSSGLDVSQLSDSEKSALETYIAVTSQEPSEAIPLLRRSQWNVQVRLKRGGIGNGTVVLINLCKDCNLQILRWGRT